MHEVGDAGDVGLPGEGEGADGAVSVFGDADVEFVGADFGVVVPVEEDDGVGVGLDRAGFPEAGQLRAGVGAQFGGAVELGGEQDGTSRSMAMSFMARLIASTVSRRDSSRRPGAPRTSWR